MYSNCDDDVNGNANVTGSLTLSASLSTSRSLFRRTRFFLLQLFLLQGESPYYPAAFDFKITPALYMQLKTPKRPDVPPFAVHAHLLRNVCLMSCLPMCAAGPVRDAHAICCTMSTLSELQGPFAVDAQSTATPALCVLLQGLFCVHAHLLHADRGHVP
eukprot:g43547.t1